MDRDKFDPLNNMADAFVLSYGGGMVLLMAVILAQSLLR